MIEEIIERVPFATLLTGKPSITINGSLEAFKEAPPRILISELDPGEPPVFTVKPATLPLSKFSAVTLLPLLKSSSPISATDPVRSFFVVVP